MNHRILPSDGNLSDQRHSPLVPEPSPAVVPRKWTWHYRELKRLMDRLSDECQDRRADDAHPIEHHPYNPADCASDEAEHDLRRADSSFAERNLSEVQAALHRILDGSYGVCERTGLPIEPARLRAIPWTRFSKSAEEAFESEGLARKPQLGHIASLRPSPVPGGIAIEDDEETEEPAADETLHEITPRQSSKAPPHGRRPADSNAHPH